MTAHVYGICYSYRKITCYVSLRNINVKSMSERVYEFALNSVLDMEKFFPFHAPWLKCGMYSKIMLGKI